MKKPYDLLIVHEGDRPAISPEGVDLTLIRWMLSMTPRERLETLQNTLAGLDALRQKSRES